MTLRRVKRRAVSALARGGVHRLVAGSSWRQRRLLILCYHGVSLAREHEWRPILYMTQDQLRERFEHIRDGGYTVLPLIEGIWRLRNGTLPPRSVVLTFDDGGHDFHERSVPLLEEFGFPATVYLSTYYCLKQAPIFPLMCSYMLWLALGRTLPMADVIGSDLELDLPDRTAANDAFWRLLRFARVSGLDDAAKQEMLRRLASSLRLDYAALLESRVMQLMSPEEVSEVARLGFDIQLHTHRHRSPDEEGAYRDEIRTNRDLIREMTGRLPRHFCYPSGAARPEFLSWLQTEGVHSATTCTAALAAPGDHRLLLPRLLDHSSLSLDEFDAWLSGVGHFLSRRRADPTVAEDSPAAHIAHLERRTEDRVPLARAH